MEMLLDPKQVAQMLGIKPSTVYSWASRRKVPSVKVGASLRFRPSVLQAWLEKQERPERT